MDDQHRQWIHLIDTLREALRQNRGNDVLESMLARVAEYTSAQFIEEEMLLRSCHYREFMAQKKLHDGFIYEMGILRENVQSGTRGASLTRLDSLKRWLVNHITVEDGKYDPHLTATDVR